MSYKDKEKEKANSQAYREAHREEKRAYDLAHRQEASARRQADRQAHPGKRKAHRLAHREEENAKSRARHQAHREQDNAKDRAYYLAHVEQEKARSRNYRPALMAEALRVFGNTCACPGCEVSEPAFLTIDHINGRPKGSRGQRMMAILEAKASGWDKTQFQILCYNCNCAKRDRGFCPVHQRDPGHRNGHSPTANAQQSLSSL